MSSLKLTRQPGSFHKQNVPLTDTKGKVVPVHVMKVQYMRNRSIAPLILNLSTR